MISTYAFAAGTFTIYSWPLTPSSQRGRAAFLSLLLLGTVAYWHWEAMIISFLAVRTVALPFLSMEELATKTDFKVRYNCTTF